MKTNRMYQRGIAALAGLLILALGACADLFAPKERERAGETIPPGMGLARISLNLGGERTVLPNIGSYYFTLDFIATGKTTVNRTLTGFGTVSVALEPATWTLEVKGYTDPGHSDHKLTGRMSISITPDTDTEFDVYLTPILGSGGLGTLSYSIDLSAISSPTGRAFLGLYPLEAPGTTAHQSVSREINLSSSAGSSVSDTISNLPEGTYRAVVDLYDGNANKAAVRTEVVHIYANLPTSLTYSFAPTDFAECPPEIDGTTLAGKLDAALKSASGSYTIVLGDEINLTAFAPKTLKVTGGKNISITIRGNGKEVQVSTTGTPLFTLQTAANNDRLTLELRDITLKGKSDNNKPVVQVNARGTLAMKPGSLITGNTSFTNGGGVYVDSSGTFNMSGGAVSGNYARNGGGVYVANNEAIFTMSGGAVSGNDSASTGDGGGGVFVIYSGTFTMSGGAVSGNDSDDGDGGGVYVDSSGTFNLSGGAVSGNSSNAYGGGMFVGSSSETFNLSGGAVSGNYALNGGGVCLPSGTFTMSGGVVRDNILSNDANSFGQEVLVYGGIFKLSGDAMPQRVFLRNKDRSITISGPLSGGTISIDLGITFSVSLEDYAGVQILKKDTAYTNGDLAELKTHFSLGEAKRTDTSDAGTPITGYKIDDDGKLVTAP